MNTINDALAQALEQIERPGDFYATGKLEFLAPRIEVAGVGQISLPLQPAQAEQLIAAAERAPYGKGEETLIDTDVRRTWQIGAERVRIEGGHWQKTLETLVARAAEGLGVTVPVVAELYKLLAYDAGSFFVSHRDTEKAPGMFATLAVVLPSLYTGGELLIRHRDQEARLDLSGAEPCELAYAAFYADCVHEVLPVASGCKLTLIYNLLREDGKAQPAPPSYSNEQARVAEVLRGWAAGKAIAGDASPEKLIYPLEHAYSQAELAFAALKGVDANIAGIALAAADEADCDVQLALVSIEESGSAEYGGYYDSRRKRRYYDDDDEDNEDFEIGEICDRHLRLTDWQKPSGERSLFTELPFEETELCPLDAFEGLEPDSLHFHEATGNEGASFDRAYRRAGLVFWPRARLLAVLNQGGLSMTLPCLTAMREAWERGGGDAASPLWRQAHQLSGLMLSSWPREDWRYRGDSTAESVKMLEELVRLGDLERIDAYMAELSAQGIYGKSANPGLTEAAGLLSARRAAELLELIVASNAAGRLDACAELLSRASLAHGPAIDLRPAATALANALPDGNSPPAEAWRRPAAVNPGAVADVLAALVRIDPALAERAALHILSFSKAYPLDASLLPAVLSLWKSPETRASSAVQSLHAACREHLRARIAETLEPPRDWARASAIACKCAHCQQLSLFLADPERKAWTFKAAQAERDHVTDSIKRAQADLDLRTETRGRPYSLICNKNQASYAQRARQRKQDLEDAARLDEPAE